MTAWSGTAKIVRFNWPWFVAAGLVAAVVGWLLAAGALEPPWHQLATWLAALAGAWFVLSLVVSHVVYDRSAVARGEWLDARPWQRVGVFHLGQDEASEVVARRLPHATRRTFDLHDPGRTGSPSLRRARAFALASGAPAATAAALDRLPLADHSLDLAVLAFAAHEVRAAVPRIAMFRELARVLAADGRIVVVEHLRDGWNLLAYGPGAFHFLSHATWRSTFAAAGLAVVGETRLVPWVCRFELRRTP